MAVSPYIPLRFSYNAIAINHAVTIRWTYTVPAGHRSVVEYALVQLVEGIAIPGLAACGILIALNGVLMIVEYNTNVISTHQAEMSGELSLIAGDVLTGQTFNTVATNAVFTVTASIKEYT